MGGKWVTAEFCAKGTVTSEQQFLKGVANLSHRSEHRCQVITIGISYLTDSFLRVIVTICSLIAKR
jgi:hypothetical protein